MQLQCLQLTKSLDVVVGSPTSQTGKKLSPRSIMMKTRDRVEEVSSNILKKKAVFK